MKKSNKKRATTKIVGESIPKRRNYWLPLLLILVATFIAYSPTFENNFVDWDDDFYVEKNTLITKGEVGKMFQLNVGDAIKAAYDKEARETLDKSSFVVGNYHPLTIYSLYLNYSNSKLDPFSYQFTNLFLHLVNVLLVFLLLKRILPDKQLGILIGTALFALHPMHVESVSWVSERKDVLYSLFFLLGLLSYFRYREKRELLFLVLTFVLFLASCLFKPAAVVFPLVIILIDFYVDRKIFLKSFLRYTPMLAISFLFGLITLSAQVDSGAVGKIEHLSQMEQIVLAGHSIILYLFKFFIPSELCALYPIPSSVDGTMYITFLLSLLIIFFVLKYHSKDRNITFGFVFFLINLILILQVVSVGSAMIADRYTYVPYIGLSIITGVLLGKGLEKWKSKLLFIYVPIGFILILSGLTFNRIKIWKNTETLFSDVIAKEPGQSLGWGTRGTYLKKLGDNSTDLNRRNKYLKRALKDLSESLKLDPDNTIIRNNRGNIYFNNQEYKKALDDYLVCDELGDSTPILLTNMASAKFVLNYREDAFNDFERALKVDSTFEKAYMNRGIALLSVQEYTSALSDFQTYLRYDPLNAGIINSVGLCYRGLKQENNAIRSFDRAIANATKASDKSVFHFNRGVSYYSLGRKSEAKSDFIIAQQNGYGLPDALKIEFNL